MPGGEEFCNHNPHLNETEVFGSQKHKPNTPIVANEETHCPNTINFSQPYDAQSTIQSHASHFPTIVKESSPSVLEVPPSPHNDIDFSHVTVV